MPVAKMFCVCDTVCVFMKYLKERGVIAKLESMLEAACSDEDPMTALLLPGQ